VPARFEPVPAEAFREPSAEPTPYQVIFRLKEKGRVVDEAAVCFTLGVSEPVIHSVAPEAGEPGSRITIRGESFGPKKGSNLVTFDGVAATQVASWADTAIEVEVPKGAKSGPLLVVKRYPALKTVEPPRRTPESGVPTPSPAAEYQGGFTELKSNAVPLEVGTPAGPQSVHFSAFRTLKSPVGSSRQNCQDFTLRVYKGKDLLATRVSEQASDTGGLVEVPLPVGAGYSFELDYKYRRPAATGTAKGTFYVAKGGVEVRIDTEGAANVVVRPKLAPKPPADLKRVGTKVAMSFQGTRKFGGITLSEKKGERFPYGLRGPGDELSGTITVSGSASAPVTLGTGNVLIEPKVAKGAETGFRVLFGRPANPQDDTVDVTLSVTCKLDKAAFRCPAGADAYEDWSLAFKGYRFTTATPELQGRSIVLKQKSEESSSGSFQRTVTPGSEHGCPIGASAVFDVTITIRSARDNSALSTHNLEGEVGLGGVTVAHY
jgi:hypothetical protein